MRGRGTYFSSVSSDIETFVTGTESVTQDDKAISPNIAERRRVVRNQAKTREPTPMDLDLDRSGRRQRVEHTSSEFSLRWQSESSSHINSVAPMDYKPTNVSGLRRVSSIDSLRELTTTKYSNRLIYLVPSQLDSTPSHASWFHNIPATPKTKAVNFDLPMSVDASPTLTSRKVNAENVVIRFEVPQENKSQYPTHDSHNSTVKPEKPLLSEPQITKPILKKPEKQSIEPEIPPWLQRATQDEAVSIRTLTDLLNDQGMTITRALALLNSSKNILVTYPAKVFLSLQKPFIIVQNTTTNKIHKLIVDPTLGPVTSTDQIDIAFANVLFSEDGVNKDYIRRKPGIIAYFRNLRFPMWFETQSPEETIRLRNAILVVRRGQMNARAEILAHFTPFIYVRPAFVPPPALLNGKRRSKFLAKLPDHVEKQRKFVEVLRQVTQDLVTSKAVATYWKTEQLIWTTFYSEISEKWKRKHLSVFVHSYSPHLIVADKQGGVLKGIFDLLSYSNGRIYQSTDANVPVEISVMNTGAVLTFLDLLDSPSRPMWFAFKNIDRLRDFQQTIATLIFID